MGDLCSIAMKADSRFSGKEPITVIISSLKSAAVTPFLKKARMDEEDMNSY